MRAGNAMHIQEHCAFCAITGPDVVPNATSKVGVTADGRDRMKDSEANKAVPGKWAQ